MTEEGMSVSTVDTVQYEERGRRMSFWFGNPFLRVWTRRDHVLKFPHPSPPAQTLYAINSFP
jgi:hypothetical protein